MRFTGLLLFGWLVDQWGQTLNQSRFTVVSVVPTGRRGGRGFLFVHQEPFHSHHGQKKVKLGVMKVPVSLNSSAQLMLMKEVPRGPGAQSVIMSFCFQLGTDPRPEVPVQPLRTLLLHVFNQRVFLHKLQVSDGPPHPNIAVTDRLT